jgi:hypothetical protein
MKFFATSIVIYASPETIWPILIDGPKWTVWNTTVDKVNGAIVPGGKVKVFPKLTPGRAFPVKVTEFEPGRRMVWTGGMPLGLFKGVRTYTLTPKDGGTEFAMSEVFSGLMAPLITSLIPDMQPAFVEFAAALKARAERKG